MLITRTILCQPYLTMLLPIKCRDNGTCFIVYVNLNLFRLSSEWLNERVNIHRYNGLIRVPVFIILKSRLIIIVTQDLMFTYH